MPRTSYNVITSAVKPAERTAFNDPWALLAELDAEQKVSRWLRPPPDVLVHFYRLTARRSTPNERDVLIAKGLEIFQYRLIDAISEVQRHVLERMMAN